MRATLSLKNATGARVAIHEQDADFLSGKKGHPSPKGAMGLIFRFFSLFLRPPKVEPDIRLWEEDKVGTLTVLHVPGHTPESISLYEQDMRLIFVGHAITNRGGKLQGAPNKFSLETGGCGHRKDTNF